MKSPITGFTAVFAIGLLTCAAAAQPPGGAEERQGRSQREGRGREGRRQGRSPRPQRGEFGPPLHPLMAALDADKDGTISAAEMESAEAALKELDKNKDGKLTRAEMGPPGGRFGGPRRGGPDRSPMEHPPTGKTEPEEKILSVLEDMHQNQGRGMMNVPPEDGRVLRLLTEAVGAKHVVEIGTSNGYSAIWFCLALRTTGGRLTTYEINAERASLARENFKRAGVERIVTLVEGNAHDEVTKLKEPIDILFVDADKEGYIDYLNKLLPLVRPGGLILAHNTSSARGAMQDYLTAVTTNADLETVFVHKDAAGIGVTLKKR